MSISISITALVKQIKGIMKDNLSSSNLLGNIRQIRQNCQTKIRSLINLFLSSIYDCSNRRKIIYQSYR